MLSMKTIIRDQFFRLSETNNEHIPSNSLSSCAAPYVFTPEATDTAKDTT